MRTDKKRARKEIKFVGQKRDGRQARQFLRVLSTENAAVKFERIVFLLSKYLLGKLVQTQILSVEKRLSFSTFRCWRIAKALNANELLIVLNERVVRSAENKAIFRRVTFMAFVVGARVGAAAVARETKKKFAAVFDGARLVGPAITTKRRLPPPTKTRVGCLSPRGILNAAAIGARARTLFGRRQYLAVSRPTTRKRDARFPAQHFFAVLEPLRARAR